MWMNITYAQVSDNSSLPDLAAHAAQRNFAFCDVNNDQIMTATSAKSCAAFELDELSQAMTRFVT